MTAHGPTITLAPRRRLAMIVVALPLVLWQQMPFGGCLCSDGHFKLFCAAGLLKSDDGPVSRNRSRFGGNVAAASQPTRIRACCRAAKTHGRKAQVTSRKAEGHGFAAVCETPCRCSTIARSSDAVLSRAAEKGPELKVFDLLAYVVPSVPDVDQTTIGTRTKSAARFRHAPTTIALCRLLI